jgi:SurA N-terminal domain
MTNSFRKHHKTILWIIIVGTIISFVYFLSPSARNAGGGYSRGSVNHGSIDGEPITDLQFETALRDARLFSRLTQGHWPTVKEETSQTNIAYQRLFIDAELKQMNLKVTDEAAANYTRGMFPKPFSQDQFNDFVKKTLNDEGKMTLGDFDHFIRGEVGQELLLSLFGMTGQLISQKEAEFFFRRDNEMMNVELVRFPISNYLAKVTFTTEEVGAFYTNNKAAFGLPPRVAVNYIKFEMTNYMTTASNIAAGMTNLNSQIDMNYDSTGPAAFTNEAGVQLSAEAAKAKIRDYFLQQIAAKSAQTNILDLAHQLLDGRTKEKPVTKEDMVRLAGSNNLVVVTTKPFDAENPPADLTLAPRAVPLLFQLQFGDPSDQYQMLPGTNGFYLVGLQEQFPAQEQSLEAVRDKVTDDYRREKAVEMVKNLGTAFETALKAGLARGQTFDAICAAQGIKPENLTPFAVVSPSIPDLADKQEFEFLVRIVYELPTGQASELAPFPDGGVIAYVKSRTSVDDAVIQRDIPSFIEKFRRQRQIEAYQGWMQREFPAHIVVGAGS